jgi:hypothetical protein
VFPHELLCFPKIPSKRLHRNMLAIALANKLARIAWAILHNGRAFECVKTNATSSRRCARRPGRSNGRQARTKEQHEARRLSMT